MPTHRDPGRELRLFLDGRLLRGLLVMTMVAIGAVPVAAQTSTIGWDELGIADEAAIPTGTTFSDGGTEMTITWSTVTDGGSFVAAFGADFLSYEAGSQGGEVGNACMGFNNGNDDPDDKVILSLGFSPPVTGLTLSLLDVDSGTFDDGVEIFANGVNQRNSAAVVSIGSAVALDNETYMQGYEGIGTPVGTTSPNGNIDLDFTTTAMTTFRVEFFSTDDANANPGGQLVCLTDLDFDTRIDFGDAPNSYGTLLVDDGARHPLANGLLLGTSRDGIENDGIPTAAADGDGADEDGVTFSSPSGTGDSVFADVVVVNPTGGTVSVCGWLDIPAGGTVDGAFDASDGICQTTAAANPTLSFQWSGLPSDQQYDTYARFRVSSDTMTTADATGVFTDGEVEDYPVSFDFSPTRATIDSFAASFVAVETLRA
ncbi:MAG: GEVED domain-containing protein, partial [Acidobacteriota bacterium]